MSLGDSGERAARFRRDVLATLLFDGSPVFPSSPFAFLEQEARANEEEVARAVEASGISSEDLTEALEIIRRPERILLLLEWGPNGERRSPFAGKGSSFVLAFLLPSDECLISPPITADRLAEMLMTNIGWAETPVVGELPVTELAPDRFDIFAVTIEHDEPPADASAMTRAAFAGPRGSRVMVLPRKDEETVGMAALAERDLRTLVAALLGLPRPAPEPPPEKVIDIAVHEEDSLTSSTLYVFETELIEHRGTSDGYVVERYPTGDLDERLMALTGLRPTEARDAPPFRVSEGILGNARHDEVPSLLAHALGNRRRLVVASALYPSGEGVAGAEITWVDSGDLGIWRIEAAEQEGEVWIQSVSGDSIRTELLAEG